MNAAEMPPKSVVAIPHETFEKKRNPPDRDYPWESWRRFTNDASIDLWLEEGEAKVLRIGDTPVEDSL